jgi:acyl-[acyl-carrier-protein]-phospholipid O-acyltransferase/long-chain-fatty-acid--[acyl-carrier-protein] ligase
MSHSQFGLLRTRRFLPLFVTQALGAFNDNAFKNALVILVTFALAERAGIDSQLYITAAAGLFIAPFFLFSATAGQLADKFEKSMLIRRIKLLEIALMGLAAIGFWRQDPWWLLGVLFLMGTQSTLFGPLKYSILPQHLEESELIGGNALIETGTFLAILLGTLFGGLLVLSDAGMEVVSATLIGLAVLGYLASFAIPAAAAPSPGLRLSANVPLETWRIIRVAAEQRGVFLSVLGISWFWLVGIVFLTQFPSYSKDVLHADEQVTNLFIATFSIGIAIGSLLCNRLLKGRIAATYVPIAALAITAFTIDLVFASRAATDGAGALLGVGEFLAIPAHWRLLGDLVGISVAGGVYVVPLYAIVQSRSAPQSRSRTIAGNNVLNALFMVAATLASLAMLSAGFTITQVFLVMAIANGFVAVYICKLLPNEVVKSIGRLIFRVLYRVEVRGLENYDKAGPRRVIVANHTSFLDAPILGSFMPETPVFGINIHIARKWWVRPAFLLFDLMPLDPTRPLAVRSLVKRVRENRDCVIFPEGRLTVTGALMKVYEGPATIAQLADATLLPVRIEGAQRSKFSRLRGKMRLTLFPKITITIMPPKTIEAPKGLVGRTKRQWIGARLYDVMANMVFETSAVDQPLFEGLLDARAVHGAKHAVIEDVERNAMTYDRLVLASFVLGRALARRTINGEHVGLMLPNSNGVVAAFFALHAHGRVPAMLNYSTGALNMVHACRAAGIKTVLTSERFVRLARLEKEIEALGEVADIVYLEDVRKEVSLADKVAGLLARRMPRLAYRRLSGAPAADAAAVVLFTSGSEGTPKGVVLSHANIQANRYQLSARIDFNASDRVFNALPVFHSFGLTAGLMLPLFNGVKTFLYPSPLHYRIVPELVYGTDATILFGTDTFLAGYARAAHPYDFYSVRYVFAGAERLKPETRAAWADKFGLRILEGYGATETAPAIAINTPMHFKPGTVGRLLPGIEHRLEPVPGIDDGGRLEVKGPNVMKGYLRADNPGVLEAPPDGWYDTGDIVSIDADGYVSIKGRAKRFAKIAGEMVSLTASEALAGAVWPDHAHAVVAVPDQKRGEQLVLLTTAPEAARDALTAHARSAGSSEIMVPRIILPVDAIPLLGTGKTDYGAALALAAEAVG